MQQREIAVRGFINEKLGSTYGKGLFRRAMINGSVELHNPTAKYLIDLYQYDKWEALAKTDEELRIVNMLRRANIHEAPDALVSNLLHYDPLTKIKTPVDGVCVYLPENGELFISIGDEKHNVSEEWTLNALPCKNTGAGKPVFVATNVDLGKW